MVRRSQDKELQDAQVDRFVCAPADDMMRVDRLGLVSDVNNTLHVPWLPLAPDGVCMYRLDLGM